MSNQRTMIPLIICSLLNVWMTVAIKCEIYGKCAEIPQEYCDMIEDMGHTVVYDEHSSCDPSELGSCVNCGASGFETLCSNNPCFRSEEFVCNFAGGDFTIGNNCTGSCCLDEDTCNYNSNIECYYEDAKFLYNEECTVDRCKISGACCMEGICSEGLIGDCNGQFYEEATCDEVDCNRKCCNGVLCRNTTKSDCENTNGVYFPLDVCLKDTCYDVGDCVMGGVACWEGVPEEICSSLKGVWDEDNMCEIHPPLGKCGGTDLDYGCIHVDNYTCDLFKGHWHGVGECPGIMGQCCIQGICAHTNEIGCIYRNYTWSEGVCDNSSPCFDVNAGGYDETIVCCLSGFCFQTTKEICKLTNPGANVSDIILEECPSTGVCNGESVDIIGSVNIDGDIKVNSVIITLEEFSNLSITNFVLDQSEIVIGEKGAILSENLTISSSTIIFSSGSNLNIDNLVIKSSIIETDVNSTIVVGGCADLTDAEIVVTQDYTENIEDIQLIQQENCDSVITGVNVIYEGELDCGTKVDTISDKSGLKLLFSLDDSHGCGETESEINTRTSTVSEQDPTEGTIATPKNLVAPITLSVIGVVIIVISVTAFINKRRLKKEMKRITLAMKDPEVNEKLNS
eukprot:TRINITY_DN10643_c0_g1_i1.p1 TRINITY_DN10643_c0_g1~~TRINITY_DN10643_c0_g1_i1.p1  ORF type:complete len:624 (+),score=120.95 TRINITY_DN10643_c0_g1_i1:80-1951(+)